MKAPIVLTAYNRPNYFKEVLNSIASQCWDRNVYCVVDGPRHKEDVELVRESFSLSKEIIPHCETVIASQNQGVAGIMRHAREIAFKDNDFMILIEDLSLIHISEPTRPY